MGWVQADESKQVFFFSLSLLSLVGLKFSGWVENFVEKPGSGAFQAGVDLAPPPSITHTGVHYTDSQIQSATLHLVRPL